MKLPELWIPVDFYISVSGTRERTLHVPRKVVDLWAESQGIQERSFTVESRLLVHFTVTIDFQLSPKYRRNHGHQASTKGRSSPL